MEIKDRISEIMKREHLAPSIFAESIGVQRSALSHILNGRNNPSLDVVMKIHQAYNFINLEWLLYGKGKMIDSEIAKGDSMPFLFDEKTLNMPSDITIPEYRKEMTSNTHENNTKKSVIQEIKYIEKPQRKITEIRIFFDDNTFEIFKSEK